MSAPTFQEPRPGQLVGELTFRVTLCDMDGVNIFFATYFDWMDRSQSELLSGAGHPLSGIFDGGFAFPVVQSGCSYAKPVTLDEVLRVRSWVSRMGTTSFTITYDFARVRDGERVAQGFTTHVWVRRSDIAPTRLPEWLRKLATE